MKKTVIVYDRTDTESIVAKNKAKRENPNALIIESSNKEILKETLAGCKVVINCYKNLDKRHLKGDTVNGEKPKENTKKPLTIPEKILKKIKGKKAMTANEIIDLMPKSMNSGSIRSAITRMSSKDVISKSIKKGETYYKAK